MNSNSNDKKTPNTGAPSIGRLLDHANWVRDLARTLVTDPATADDLAQETWVRALRTQPDASGPVRPWLGKVLRNVWRERGRSEAARTRRDRSVSVPEALSSTDEQLEQLELQRLLSQAVAELDEPHRSLVIWRYYEGLSSAEIARRQNEPADRIRQRLVRANELLRVRLKKDHGDH